MMRCEDVMIHDVEYISPDQTVEQAARIMRNCNIGFLPVCSKDRQVVGVLTDRDLAIRVLAERLPPTTQVSAVMTRDIIGCYPQESVRRAEELMSQFQKSRVLCLSSDWKLRGVISLADIVRALPSTRAAALHNDIVDRERELSGEG